MEFRQVNYFLAVAYHKNFSHAAEYLHVTQPTLSQQINELENELGVKLFERTNRVSELTPAGHAFMKEAVLLKEQFSRCLRSVSPYIDGGTLNIGKVYSFEPDNLLSLVNHFINSYPSIKFDLNSYSYKELLNKLRDHSVDAAFVVIPEQLKLEETEHVLVGHDRLSIIVPKKHPYGHLTSLEDSDFRELLSFPMYLHKPGYYYEDVLDLLSGIHRQLNVQYVDSASAISMSMFANQGFTILHEKWFFSYLPRDQFTVIPLPEEIGLLQVSFIYNKKNKNPCIQVFLEEALKNFREKTTAPTL